LFLLHLLSVWKSASSNASDTDALLSLPLHCTFTLPLLCFRCLYAGFVFHTHSYAGRAKFIPKFSARILWLSAKTKKAGRNTAV